MFRRLILICLIGCFFSSISYCQNIKQPRYFDENNIEISKKQFESVKAAFSISGDSVNHSKILLRKEKGSIEKIKDFYSVFQNLSNQKLDTSQILVFIYHPGKDICNSSGTATRATKKTWFSKMEKGLKKYTSNEPIYIYKVVEGLRDYQLKDFKYIKDPGRLLERLFFIRHYPCSSFVMVSPSGEYISNFGEFGKEQTWEYAKELTE